MPSTEQQLEEKEIEDPHFEIIHHLIDYCRFKQAAKELATRHEKQQTCYFRGVDIPEWKKPLGIDHVSLDELAALFKEMISKAEQTKPQIQEENWRVCDKIKEIRRLLKEYTTLCFAKLFIQSRTRPEMIVTFLAILELMKIGEISVGRDQATTSLWVFSKEKI